MNRKPLLLFFLSFFLFSCGNQDATLPLQQPAMRLWYEQPAAGWQEALPAGNGRMGVMVFGGTHRERIQLNEESLWAGQPLDNNNPEALQHLPELRRLLLAEKVEEATALVKKYFLGTPPRVRSYQTAGDLFIISGEDAPAEEYERELALETGVVKSRWRQGDTQYYREVFVSAPADVIVIRTRAEGPAALEERITLKRSRDAQIRTEGNDRLVMTGQIHDLPDSLRGPGGEHMRFAGVLQVLTKKGTVRAEDTCLTVTGAREMILLLTLKTDYDPVTLSFDRMLDPLQWCRERVAQAVTKDFRRLYADHVKDHAAFFNRVQLQLPATEISSLPTDQRLAAVKKGKADPALAALYFQYGRYLLMGSSRAPGVLPANLQGVWNDKYEAPWNADFHTNINLQMNYWPAEVANLPECVAPLSRFMERLERPASRTARKMYGARGWTFHHLTDAFGRTGVADGPWGLTPMDGPWMTFPLWRHYAYTLDTAYLRTTAWPLMRGAARFVLDFLVEGPGGYLVTVPSSSPENAYYLPGTKKMAKLTYDATMDIEIIRGLFDHCLKALEVLGSDPGLRDSITAAMKRLPPFRIGKDGTLQEWIQDYEEPWPGHRHISHLLGLYPLHQISPEKPELFEAARRTIERRLSHGGGHTGWSRAWIINFYDRLQMGEEAHKHLLLLFNKSTQPNLFDTHPPFQIDGSFGGTAGIAGMLLQSWGGEIRLLPALPKAWDHGEVRGLKARGNHTVGIRWKEHRPERVKIQAGKTGTVTICYGKIRKELSLKKGEICLLDGDLKKIREQD
jgi:alpha-L-fucosidase 2